MKHKGDTINMSFCNICQHYMLPRACACDNCGKTDYRTPSGNRLWTYKDRTYKERPGSPFGRQVLFPMKFKVEHHE